MKTHLVGSSHSFVKRLSQWSSAESAHKKLLVEPRPPWKDGSTFVLPTSSKIIEICGSAPPSLLQPENHEVFSQTPINHVIQFSPNPRSTDHKFLAQIGGLQKINNEFALSLDECLTSPQSLPEIVLSVLSNWFVRPIPLVINIDLDVFPLPFKGNLFTQSALGICPHQTYELLNIMLRRGSVRAIIFSGNIPNDSAAEQLSAQFAYRFMCLS